MITKLLTAQTESFFTKRIIPKIFLTKECIRQEFTKQNEKSITICPFATT